MANGVNSSLDTQVSSNLLSPKIKIVWYLEKIAFFVPLIIGLFIISLLLPQNSIELFLAAAFALVVPYLYVHFKYARFSYALREKDLIIRKGIIERIDYVVPYDKIQNVTISRNTYEVLFGLATLHIETAAHFVVEKDITIPGVSNYHDLTNQLIVMSKKARDIETKHADSQEIIVNELKGLNEKLGAIAERLHKNAEIITKNTLALEDIKTKQINVESTPKENVSELLTEIHKKIQEINVPAPQIETVIKSSSNAQLRKIRKRKTKTSKRR